MSQAQIKSERGQSDRGYWLCQLLGWGTYGLGYYLIVLVPLHSAGPVQGLEDLAYCSTGLVGTHLLRLRMKRHSWNELPYVSLTSRLVLAAILIGVLQTTVLDSSLTLGGQVDWRQTNPLPIIGMTLFSSALLIAFWLAVYLTVHSVRRRRAAEVDALRAKVFAREAELRSLQRQLNPHFLFNSLNSIRGMIDEDPGRARTMVTRLAELLRASLEQNALNAIPLEEELATVNAYLELESVRLEERLRICRDIEPALGHALIPPMLLQGLVENALKHGIAQLPGGGDLVLRVTRAGDALRVEVGNTGHVGKAQGEGIGLTNTRERLRLLYGDHANFELAEEPSGWVRATAEFPLETRRILCER